MRAADSFDSAVDFLDERLRAALLGVDSRVKESAYEIRLRAARPVVIVTRGGSLFVYKSGRTGLVYSPGALAATPAELQASFSRMCGYSVHSLAALFYLAFLMFRRRGERVYKPRPRTQSRSLRHGGHGGKRDCEVVSRYLVRKPAYRP